MQTPCCDVTNLARVEFLENKTKRFCEAPQCCNRFRNSVVIGHGNNVTCLLGCIIFNKINNTKRDWASIKDVRYPAASTVASTKSYPPQDRMIVGYEYGIIDNYGTVDTIKNLTLILNVPVWTKFTYAIKPKFM